MKWKNEKSMKFFFHLSDLVQIQLELILYWWLELLMLGKWLIFYWVFFFAILLFALVWKWNQLGFFNYRFSVASLLFLETIKFLKPFFIMYMNHMYFKECPNNIKKKNCIIHQFVNCSSNCYVMFIGGRTLSFVCPMRFDCEKN